MRISAPLDCETQLVQDMVRPHLEGTTVQPFLKWPGGKRWFVNQHQELMPENYSRYIEPFLGSGAVFFAVNPSKAILGDLNKDLIHVYKAIKSDWQGVESELRRHKRLHGDAYYYRVRDSIETDPIKAAARIIYLNRTCFNGIYRVNKSGKFNVPKGTRDSVIFDSDNFREVAKRLKNATLVVADFESVIDEARKGDFIFADPPYTVRHNNNGFIKYNEMLFSWDDQIRLAQSLARARKRGAFVVSTNANHKSVQELYRESGFAIRSVSRYSSISANSECRKQFEELIILNQ